MTEATKSRDSLKQVRADMVTKSDLETFGKSLVLQMAKLIPARNDEEVEAEVTPIYELLGLPESVWDTIPTAGQDLLEEQHFAIEKNGPLATDRPSPAPSKERRVTGNGPFQKIIDNTRGIGLYDSLRTSIGRVNSLVSGGKIQTAMTVNIPHTQLSSFNKLMFKNRMAFDTPVNVAKAKAGNYPADSFNASTRHRQLYRKPDEADGSNAIKFDGLVLDIHIPKKGQLTVKVLEYSNPIRS